MVLKNINIMGRGNEDGLPQRDFKTDRCIKH